jgi:hypothetical protein
MNSCPRTRMNQTGVNDVRLWLGVSSYEASSTDVLARGCMDAYARGQHHSRVRVLPHIEKLDDCFGQFLVRVSCACGAVREVEPEALARLVG